MGRHPRIRLAALDPRRRFRRGDGEVMGREGTTARPDFPACGSQAAFVLTMRNGGVASVTLDYLRPEPAPTHGDERLRIAGTRGVIEAALIEHKVTLITAD